MLLVFLVFFVFSVLSYFANTEQSDCVAVEKATDRRSPGFRGDIIFAVRVCVTINPPVNLCSRAKDSYISLNITHDSGTEALITNITLTEAGGRFCEVYDPCRIAKALEGKHVEFVRFRATAKVFASPASIDIRTSDDVKIARREIADFPPIEHELLSFICSFLYCSIQTQGHGGDGVYYFRNVGLKKIPLCVNESERTRTDTFSVTYFLCDPRCSRKYEAVSARINPPPSTTTTTTAAATTTVATKGTAEIPNGEKKPSNGGARPSDGGAKPSDGGAKPSDGGAKPSDGGAKPSDGGAKPSDGGAKPSDGGAKPSDGGAEPSDGGAEPFDGETKPSDGGAEPFDGETEPSDGGAKPSEGGTKPFDGGAKPSDGGAKPPDVGAKPSNRETELSNGEADATKGLLATATTTKKSDALSHLSTGTILTVAVFALLV